jgi:hypothetical protein
MCGVFPVIVGWDLPETHRKRHDIRARVGTLRSRAALALEAIATPTMPTIRTPSGGSQAWLNVLITAVWGRLAR